MRCFIVSWAQVTTQNIYTLVIVQDLVVGYAHLLGCLVLWRSAITCIATNACCVLPTLLVTRLLHNTWTPIHWGGTVTNMQPNMCNEWLSGRVYTTVHAHTEPCHKVTDRKVASHLESRTNTLPLSRACQFLPLRPPVDSSCSATQFSINHSFSFFLHTS